MAKLALAKSFLDDFAKLDSQIRAAVHKNVSLFDKLDGQQLYKHKGLHLESHKNSADSRARTIRIDMNHRGIVLDVPGSELFVLVKVGTHDATDNWMAKNTFKVNAATGALEVVSSEALVLANESISTQAESPTVDVLFKHRNDKDFIQLGIETDLMPALRAFTSEDQLLGILPFLPQAQADALIELITDDTVEQIYASIAGQASQPSIDLDDFDAALEAPATRGSFHLVEGQDELAVMLSQPLAQWRVFLHHTQYDMANRPSYSGPVRITGGAGTGKTIVAIHRAKALSGRLQLRAGKPILFTTYTKNLALDIEQQLRTLDGTKLLNAVEVANIDRVAHGLVKTAEGARPRIVTNDQLEEIWESVIDDLELDYSQAFLMAEWEQVILAQNLTNRTDYFKASRAGRGVPLDRRPRALVWKAIELFMRRMAEKKVRTHLQIAAAAADYCDGLTIKPYEHVIVDETQDLHEAQLRLLRALVSPGPDDLFLVGDSHQRIYNRKSSLSKVGIQVRGRSKKLKINYRTTHQILAWSMALLGETPFDDLDEGNDDGSLTGYHSYRKGPVPELSGHKAKKYQLDALTERITGWITDGVEPESIGISSRVKRSFPDVEATLRKAGVGVVVLPSDDLPRAKGVRLGTMHRLKGLEFERVAIIDVDDKTIPNPHALPNPNEDIAQFESALLQEQCLLYVAATRARDELWVGWSGKPSRFLGVVGAE